MNRGMLIDTHAHLYDPGFREEMEEVVGRASEAGVRYIVLPDIDAESRESMLELAARYPEMMRPLAGLHPTSVKAEYKKELAAIEKALAQHTFYGIGECGIDLYWDKTFYREQVKVFEHLLGMARELDFPVVVHSRDSLNEIFEVLRKYPYTKGVLHCFSGTPAEAERACGMGLYLGIGGVVTFKKSGMAEVIRSVGPERLVLETDAPYLAPVPYRGQRNESAYLPLILRKISELTGCDEKKIGEITTRNALDLFNLHRNPILS